MALLCHGRRTKAQGTNVSESLFSTAKPAKVNDFTLQVATANGSGSQSANLVLLRTLFGMGLPVSGKNLFPSNISGLPTWFTIRVNEAGHLARRDAIDLLVAMNRETLEDDVRSLMPGSVLVLNQDFKGAVSREDLIVYQVPFQILAHPLCPEVRLKKYVVNMVYVGVLAHLLDLEAGALDRALQQVFAGKDKALSLNRQAMEAGRSWAGEKLVKRDGLRVQARDLTEGKILIEGNQAAAVGCLMAGVSVLSWYPITPASSLCENLIDYLYRFRTDADGKKTFAALQAEDELAAMGMALGAGWAGARALTVTSGPGLSLMAESAGLGYFAEIPAVVIDVQRCGPSTGLPTRTQQGDVLSAALLSHGDSKHPLLIPGTPLEVYQFAQQAFDLAEQLQTPVFVLLDLDLGMNVWLSDPFPYPDSPLRRGKLLMADDLDSLGDFQRYRDVDGDGIPYRTLPGTEHPLAAYFTRGTGHNDQAQYSEKPGDYVKQLDRLERKWQTAKLLVPPPVVELAANARIGIVAYGSSEPAVREARQLLADAGIPTHALRLRGYPFNQEVDEFLRRCDTLYVVDQNRDAQMKNLLAMHFPEWAGKLRALTHYNGLPLSPDVIAQSIQEDVYA